MIKIIDDAIEPNQLVAAVKQFPETDWQGYHHYSDNDSEKYGSKPKPDLPVECLNAINQLHRKCECVIKPPHFADLDLFGSGLHRMEPGGYLRRHLDSSVHRLRGWERTYSCVLFGNKCGGGALHVETGTGEVCNVEPRFNRLVIFRTNETSWHWVDSVTGPFPRLSLSLFYYRSSKPADPTRIQARFAGFE